MRRTFVEVAVAISLTLAAIFASATGVNASGVMVMDAFARASATPTAASGAAYISLMNHGAGADRLLSASTPAAQSAEIHKTDMVDGVMKMLAAGPVDIPQGGTLEMKPGGYHIMLMELKRPIKEGDTVPLTLTVQGADGQRQTIEVKAAVKPLGAPEPGAGHGHHHHH